MKFDERMMEYLPTLAEVFLRNKEYGYLSRVADMMVGFSSGGWSRLGDDERVYYLEKLKNDFHPRAMGESKSCWDNSDYYKLTEIIDNTYRALTKK